MHHHYNDIRDRIATEPKWWDEHAVPRYCDFFPDETANIYAQEVVLLLIACQDCGHEFHVCMSSSPMDTAVSAYPSLVLRLGRKPTDEEYHEEIEAWTLASLVKCDKIHYGDPPNACPPSCCAGATMNSVPLKVLQFWRRDKLEWKRVPELERKIDCEWARDG